MTKLVGETIEPVAENKKGKITKEPTEPVAENKSTSGYVFMMSGGAIAWSSRKQPIVTLSTT